MGSQPALTPEIDVRRSADRKNTSLEWLESRHSFAFGRHYDPANTHFGLLLVNNEDVVQAGMGYATHQHRDMEIVTWVLEGSLVHLDSKGNTGLIYPGLAQRMSAGTGIEHSEKNESWTVEGEKHENDVRFVQMWLPPDTRSIEPSYEQADISDALGPVEDGSGRWVVVASGMDKHRDSAAVSIRQRLAALSAARLPTGGAVELPRAPFVHLYVTRGTVDLEGVGVLQAGDAARVTLSDGRKLTATGDAAEVLAWEMVARLPIGWEPRGLSAPPVSSTQS